MKDPRRAAAKARVCYRGDVSRLADVCRARLRFGDPAGLRACLDAATAGWGGARVVRVRNRLRDGCEAEDTAGYRDVLVNLCVSTEETRRLRLDAVVCELQLALLDFVRLQVNTTNTATLSKDKPCKMCAMIRTSSVLKRAESMCTIMTHMPLPTV